LNPGSQSDTFLNNGVDDDNHQNEIRQDGAVLVDLKEPEWATNFTAFTAQLVPTNDQ
jgi:uncharacterized protein YukJ